MLKAVELVPAELELLKEINWLKEQAGTADDENARVALRLKISELQAVLRDEDANLSARGPALMRKAVDCATT